MAGKISKIIVQTIVWLKSTQKQTHGAPHGSPPSAVDYHLASHPVFLFCILLLCNLHLGFHGLHSIMIFKFLDNYIKIKGRATWKFN